MCVCVCCVCVFLLHVYMSLSGKTGFCSQSSWYKEGSDVKKESYTSIRSLVGYVCQRYGPVSSKDNGTMVDVSQVMIDHTVLCKIHTSRIETPLLLSVMCWGEVVVTMKSWSSWLWHWNSYLLSCRPVGFPIFLVQFFFLFPINKTQYLVANQKSRPRFFRFGFLDVNNFF